MASETPPIGFNPKPDLDEKTKNSLYLRDNPALFDVNVSSRNLPPLLRPPMGKLWLFITYHFINWRCRNFRGSRASSAKSLRSTKSGCGSPKLPKKVENDSVMIINDISDGGTNSSQSNKKFYHNFKTFTLSIWNLHLGHCPLFVILLSTLRQVNSSSFDLPSHD